MSRYAFQRSPAEYERLVDQAELLSSFAARFLELACLRPGMRVLDLGSGAGDFAFEARRFVGPHGFVIGVDCDGQAVAFAASRAIERGYSNVEFVVADAEALPVHDQQFDAVIGRFILSYLEDPAATLSRLRSLLRGGGIFAFQEWDLRSPPLSFPHVPLLDRMHEAIVKRLRESGVHLDMGFRLVYELRKLQRGIQCQIDIMISSASDPVILRYLERTLTQALSATAGDEPSQTRDPEPAKDAVISLCPVVGATVIFSRP